MIEKGYTTKETIEKTGLSKDTIFYYEKIGVIGAIKKDGRGYRQYSKQDIDWLIIVKLLRKMGISTSQLIGAQQTNYQQRKEYLENYRQEVIKKIHELENIDRLLEQKIDYLGKIQQFE